MDKISQPLHNYLKLAHQSALLVSQADKANLNVLLTMLGTLDKDIIDAYYGLFATPQVPITQLAAKYKVTAETIQEIVDRDVRKLSITPEWQMMLRQLSPLVRKRIAAQR